MKANPTRIFGALLFVALLQAISAAETYQASLAAGDKLRTEGKADPALAEYVTATGQAANDTEKSLALGKQGMVLAYDKKDYPAAAKLADEALAIEGIQPVAEVTALQVRAECEAKGEQNHARAALALEKALALKGVDWSRPGLLLSLGDSRRHLGKFHEAIKAYEEVLATEGVPSPMKAVAHLNIGLTWQYDLKDAAKARSSYAAAVELNEGLKGEVDEHLGRLEPTTTTE
ncbi:tetratricopeptide repeat protein [Haloferula sp.]|uniref:tetratricopeptide repeat protein n=1 Tax=Haloferula sp. TaxID=2497595 RepID=UPI003C78B02C